MNKKFFFMIVSLLIASIVSVPAQNESDFKIDTSGIITAYEGWDTDVIIPGQIGDVKVLAIGSGVFRSMGLTSVAIPAGITYIGYSAFSDNKLTSLSIPDDVTIKSEAFLNNQLTSISLGNRVSITRSAFYNTSSDNNGLRLITKLFLGENVDGLNEFGDYLNYEYLCNSRKSGSYNVTVGLLEKKRENDFEYIETKYGAVITGPYSNPENRLRIPQIIGGKDVKGIATNAFYDKKIRLLQIPEGITFIGSSAFSWNQLTSVTIPSSVTYIGERAFDRNQLTDIIIPNNVISISNNSFSNNKLTSVTIGNNVTAIGEYAFSDNQLTSVTIPGSVTSIGSRAFQNNNITNVNISNGVISIGSMAFYFNQLTSVTIPNSVTSMGDQVFGYNYLNNITIGAEVAVDVGNGFDTYYNSSGKRAGTYILNDDGRWSLR